MRNSLLSIVSIGLFVSVLLLVEQRRGLPTGDGSLIAKDTADSVLLRKSVHAYGWIEGGSEAVEMRARVAEQIAEIHVVRGQWVTANQLLLSLEPARFAKEYELAAAMLSEALARKKRIEDGFRDSEIETVRQEYLAAKARELGVEKSLTRAQDLKEQRAESQQRVDDLNAQLTELRALTFAAKGRLETHQQPPREHELLLAEAAVSAARARLELCQIELARSKIFAPFDSQILALDGKVGELTGPDDDQPLIVLADTSRRRAVAEVDEFDALSIQVGQKCEITADAAPGVVANGTIVEIEPRMNPKQRYAQRVGERKDTFSRRVWIDLDANADLPIGLPVDVLIEAN